MSSERLKMAREMAGLSRRQAAMLLGFPIDHLERGAEEPTPARLEALAVVYDVTTCWLRGHDPEVDLPDGDQLEASDRGRLHDRLASTRSCSHCDRAGGTKHAAIDIVAVATGVLIW